jgi:hypothetical protein
LTTEKLEQEGIVVLMAEPDELLPDYKRKGYVKLRVSCQAYKSLADLKAALEFQYKVLRSELPLRWPSKLAALFCAGLRLPGVGVFVFLLSSYIEHGYDRRAKEFKSWYFLGLAIYILMFVTLAILLTH